ncbi:MAG: signal peptidase I [Clostridiaceae bacterium]
MKGNSRNSNKLNQIGRSFSLIFVTMIVMVAILLVGTRLIGLTPYAVLSGSMEPQYAVGSLIYVKEIEPQNIQIGDSITFILNENLIVATHRVVEITPEGSFTTKGDSNESTDGVPVHPNNVLGKPIFSIPYLGYLSVFLTSKQGKVVLGVISTLILISMLIPEKSKKSGIITEN